MAQAGSIELAQSSTSTLAQRRLDSRDHFGAPALGLHIVAGRQEGAGHQAAARQLAIIAGAGVRSQGAWIAQASELRITRLTAANSPSGGRVTSRNRCAGAGEHLCRLRERRGHLGMGGQVVFVEMADEADAQPVDAGPDRPGVLLPRRRRAGGIVGVVAGDDLEHQGRVRRVARHRADMVEGEGQRKKPPAATPVRRVGFSPTRPQQLAGLRTEPPVSVPSASGNIPDAMPAPDPEEDPPG